MLLKTLKIGNLSIQVPIIQGGMGVGISLSGLASAVANEGGVGVISAAGLGIIYKNLSKNYLEASILGLKEELSKARQKTQGVIGVNIMVALSNFANLVRTAIAETADIMFSGAGMPLIIMDSPGRAAKLICEKWKSIYNYLPDALVVEGPKAGGHLGFKNEQIDDEHYQLETILPEVIQEAHEIEEKYGRKIPVIAAGGIYSGDDIRKIMELGADGVQMGTRFVTTEECDASDVFKQTYLNAHEEDIQIIKSPVGMPGRAIFSNFIQKIKEGKKQPKACPVNCIKTCDISKSPYCIITALYNAFRGNMENGYAFAGANAFKATKIMSVKETFRSLLEEFNRTK